MNDIETRLATLEQQLVALLDDNQRLQAVTDRLEAHNAELRAQLGVLRTASSGAPDPATAARAGAPGAAAARAGTDPDEHRPVSRRGMIAAVAGAAGGIVLAQAAPAAAANGDPVKAGSVTTATATTALTTTSGNGLQVSTSAAQGSGVYASAVATAVQARASGASGIGVFAFAGAATGGTYGVLGRSESTSGTGVYGTVGSSTGTTHGVLGLSDSTSGRGVTGYATAASGTTYAVYGGANSPSGFALFGEGRLKVTGRSYLGAPSSAPADADLANGSISFYLDQANQKLKVRVRHGNGTLKTATIALA